MKIMCMCIMLIYILSKKLNPDFFPLNIIIASKSLWCGYKSSIDYFVWFSN